MKLKTLLLILAAAGSLVLTSCDLNCDGGGAKPKGNCQSHTPTTNTNTTTNTTTAGSTKASAN